MKTIKLIDGREAEFFGDFGIVEEHRPERPITPRELFDTITANQERIAELEAREKEYRQSLAAIAVWAEGNNWKPIASRARAALATE